MAITYRAHATNINDTTSPCTVDKPAGTTSGDMLLLHVHLTDDIAPGVPSGFDLVDSVGGTNNIFVYAKTAGGSEPSTYDVTFASGTCSAALTAFQSTHGRTIVVDVHDDQTNGSGDRLWPSVATNRHDHLLACFASVGGNVGSTPHSGMLERYDAGDPRIYLMTQSIEVLGATGTKTAAGAAATSKAVSIILAETGQTLRLSGSTTAGGTLITELAINKPAGVASGDLMLLTVAENVGRTVTPPDGFDLVDAITGADGVYVYAKTAGGSEPSSYTVGFSGTSTPRMSILSWRSLPPYTIVVDATNKHDETESGTTDRVAPSVTTTRANSTLHNVFAMSGADTATTPASGMDSRVFQSASGVSLFVQSQEVAATGATGTRTATAGSSSQTYKVVSVAIAEDVSSGPDGAPSGLTATAFDDDRIDLEWTDGSTNEDGFSIERSPNGTDTWAEIDTVAANETTYSDTGLTEYTNYWYRVRAFTTGPTYSDYSNTATDQTLLAAPSGLTATANGDVQIDLEWTINSAVPPDGTAIERSPNGSTGWTEIATVAHPTNTYGNSGLNPETTYYYRVRSYKVEA